MMRCPACDDANHGTSDCSSPFNMIKLIEDSKELDNKRLPEEQKKVFIGSGEDVIVFDDMPF